MMVATTTGDLPKIMVKLSGNWFRDPAAWGDAHAQGSGEPYDGGVSGRQILGGDQLHAGHGNGGEHRHRGAAQYALGDGGENGGELGGQARQQQKGAGQGKYDTVDYLVGGNDAHVLGVCSGRQAAKKSGQNITGAIGNNAALEFLVGGLPIHAAYGGGGEVADGLDGVDGKQQPDGDAGGQVEGYAEVHEPGKGEPGGAAHIGEVHHAEGQGHHVAEYHADQDGGQAA